ncbi:MAG: hypothetical protein WC197_00120 [Candidatus Gastranaerophilaceae bacterium]|jgi:hypothetical protein
MKKKFVIIFIILFLLVAFFIAFNVLRKISSENAAKEDNERCMNFMVKMDDDVFFKFAENLRTADYKEYGFNDKKREIVIDLLDNHYYDWLKKDENNFPNIIATGDIKNFCPNGLKDICLSGLVRGDISDVPGQFVKDCDNICSLLSDYSVDYDKLNVEVLSRGDWKDGFIEKQYKWRTSIAYRFKGEEGALKVCENIADDFEKNNCKKWIDYFNVEKSIQKYRKMIQEAICNMNK